ncbi:sensor histidine kinase [Curtobacterium sp. Leaf261]|uniref:sensor histidine kinase n=1 Tax=Curtobacterium sp. Leaf261 TaxID=1736311 RepID=UPI0006F9FB3F|nr:ATP-binding protein [Curtobacterium sp. Leaf261]KQO62253.1 hypothetical protein ASF23_10595 [Curtobacterium sp. Leaf261]
MQNITSAADLLPQLIDALEPDALHPDLIESLAENVRSMIEEAHARWTTGDLRAWTSDTELAETHLATGALHAEHLQHPADALIAAEMLFDAYLPVFIDEVGASTTSEVIRATKALHAGIWSRFPAGAVAYTAALRSRVTTANLDSRTQIARDLHDRIAPGVLAGIQRVDLALVTDPTPLELKLLLQETTDLLRTAMRDLQSVAVSLHARVGDQTIDVAVARSARDLFPTDERICVRTHGTPEPIAPWRAEEALTIVLEALVNCHKHAPGAPVVVEFRWCGKDLVITVSDEGPGFDTRSAATGRLGQHTMRERADLIGGALDIESAPGAGTVVRLAIPRDHG